MVLVNTLFCRRELFSSKYSCFLVDFKMLSSFNLALLNDASCKDTAFKSPYRSRDHLFLTTENRELCEGILQNIIKVKS